MLKDMLDGISALTLAEKMALLGYSKLAPEVWPDYVSDMLSGASLRACAELCGVSLKTSWFMRMRLCEVMARAPSPSARAGPSHDRWTAPTCPSRSRATAPARPSGCPAGPTDTGAPCASAAYPRSRPASVACGANDLGDSFCRLAGRGRPTDAELEASLEGLGACERVPTDGHSGYARVLPGLGAPPTTRHPPPRQPARWAWSTPCTSASSSSSAGLRACRPGASGTTWPGSGGPSILHLTLLEDLPQVVGEVGLGASGRRALAGHEA